MGLTIHYNINSKGKAIHTAADALNAVNAMRQICLDLPFEEVGEIFELSGEQIEQIYDDDKSPYRWFVIQSMGHVYYPWNPSCSRSIFPTRVIGFNTWPGKGTEDANFGLCVYPEKIQLKYDPRDDSRFKRRYESGATVFDYDKWHNHCWQKYGKIRIPERAEYTREVSTKLKHWSWHSFCKTQYATSPKCGGIANFLRCHITLITALERMAKIQGIKVTVNDEGSYGSHICSDDYEEARAAGRDPTYKRHKGKHSPSELAKEVGQWDAMIAGVAGALKDALGAKGMEVQAPITEYQNFEELEFRGSKSKDISQFLQVLSEVAKKNTPKS